MARQGLDRTAGVADRPLTWIDRIPDRLRPFAVLARWDRPIGTWLLLWPCWWAVALAPGWPDLKLLALFAIGAVAMRGAGCVINDLADRDLDARVERTRHRPLASGSLTTGEALAFLALQLLVGLLVLLSFNRFTILLGLASLPLVIVYPLMKRVTWWPQAFLGVTFNWGALVGSVRGHRRPGGTRPHAVRRRPPLDPRLRYDLCAPGQGRRRCDRREVQCPVARRRHAALALDLLWQRAGLDRRGRSARRPGRRISVMLVIAGAQLAWQVRTLDLDDVWSCLVRFRSNREFGWLVFLALLAGKVGP